jgi:MinD superfamily P-loop ATPase
MSVGDQVEIVVASGKGGVGKSTITSVLAIKAAEKGYKLVAADADAEAPNLHITLGVSDWDKEEPYYEGRIAYIKESLCTQCGICAEVCPYGAVEIREGKYWINPWICEGCVTCSLACPEKAIRYKFKIVAGKIRTKLNTKYGFPLVSGEIVPGRPNSGKLVTEVKNKAKSMLNGGGFITIDAAAGIGCQVISSIAGAHMVILVAEPTPASLGDLRRIYMLSKHFGIPAALILNKADLDREYAEKIMEFARNEGIDYLGSIPFDDRVPKAMAEMKPIIEAYPESPVSKQLTIIADKVSQILSGFEDWRLSHLPKKIEPFIPIVIKPGENIDSRNR